MRVKTFVIKALLPLILIHTSAWGQAVTVPVGPESPEVTSSVVVISGQTAQAPVGPQSMSVSPGGVDMRTGHLAHSTTDLTIGDENGLVFERHVASSGYFVTDRGTMGGYAHNWDVFAKEKRIAVAGANNQCRINRAWLRWTRKPDQLWPQCLYLHQ